MAKPRYRNVDDLLKHEWASYKRKWTVSTRTINVTFGLALLTAWFALSHKSSWDEMKGTDVMAAYSALYGILIGTIVDGFVLYEVLSHHRTGPDYYGSTKRSNIGDCVLYLVQFRAMYYWLQYGGDRALDRFFYDFLYFVLLYFLIGLWRTFSPMFNWLVARDGRRREREGIKA